MGGSSLSETASWRSAAAAPPALAWRQTSPPRSNKSFDVGQFAVLPRVPTWDANSVVYNQLQHVNGDVAGHPLCIIGTKDNGRTVTCLQVTSFGDRSIEEKCKHNPSSLYWAGLLHLLEVYFGGAFPCHHCRLHLIHALREYEHQLTFSRPRQ